MTYETLKVEAEGAVATIHLERAEVHNALDERLFSELTQATHEVATRPGVRALILTSAVPRTFSVGAHLPTLAGFGPDEARSFAEVGWRAIDALETLPFVTIAAVSGVALGGGWELALACDLIYASTGAVFGFPEVELGLFPAFGGYRRLLQMVGPMRADEMTFTAARLSARTAKELGLVLAVLPAAELYPHCVSVAERIAAKGLVGIAHVKRLRSKYREDDSRAQRALDVDAFVRSDFGALKKRN